MEEYIRFRETNNWEKERWRFYIPLMGNERAIRILADALDKLKPAGGCFVGKHIQYDIRMMPTSGDRVDRLCDAYKGKGGYMAYYNKLEGRLDIRAVIISHASFNWAADISCPFFKPIFNNA